MNKIIILLGQRVRSGTNFIGSTLKMHPDVITLPTEDSLGEFNLFRQRFIVEKPFRTITNGSFGMNFLGKDETIFYKHYGEMWLNFLTEKYSVPNGKTIFMKSCLIDNSDLWIKTFPKAKIAVICRDGRDNVISSVKASNDKRNWHNLLIRLKKKINFNSGRSFVNHTIDWVKTSKIIEKEILTTQIKLFRYEDLNDKREGIISLLKFYNLNYEESVVEKCMNAPVVGSSFGINTKHMSKPNWIPDNDKAKYKFTKKWTKWGFLKKTIFKIIAGKMLIKFDYEVNNKW